MEFALFSDDRALGPEPGKEGSPGTGRPIASGNPGPVIVAHTVHGARQLHRFQSVGSLFMTCQRREQECQQTRAIILHGR